LDAGRAPQIHVQYATTKDGVSIAYVDIGQGSPLVYLQPHSHTCEVELPEPASGTPAASAPLIRWTSGTSASPNAMRALSRWIRVADVEAVAESWAQALDLME
jgi:hypothetical protein